MKYKGLGREIVWDPEMGRALCQFKDGIYETQDPYIIRKLADLGYAGEEEKHGGQTEQGNTSGSETQAEPGKNYREAARAAGIRYVGRKKEEVKRELEEKGVEHE